MDTRGDWPVVARKKLCAVSLKFRIVYGDDDEPEEKGFQDMGLLRVVVA